MTTKPICLIKVRNDAFVANPESMPPFHVLMKAAYPSNRLHGENDRFTERDPNGFWATLTNDYIVFAIPARPAQSEPIVVQVLNASDMDEVKFEELKEMIFKAIETI